MNDDFSHLVSLLADVILPNLRTVQANQEAQQSVSHQLDRNLAEFRTEMEIRFAQLRADIAATRQQLEDTLVTLHEWEATQTANRLNKPIIH